MGTPVHDPYMVLRDAWDRGKVIRFQHPLSSKDPIELPDTPTWTFSPECYTIDYDLTRRGMTLQELKRAHQLGETIQHRAHSSGRWRTLYQPLWDDKDLSNYRVQPRLERKKHPPNPDIVPLDEVQSGLGTLMKGVKLKPDSLGEDIIPHLKEHRDAGEVQGVITVGKGISTWPDAVLTKVSDNSWQVNETKPKKEIKMKFETKYYLNNHNIEDLSDQEIYNAIARAEKEILDLSNIKAQPVRLKKDIASRQAHLAELVAYLDSRDEAKK